MIRPYETPCECATCLRVRALAAWTMLLETTDRGAPRWAAARLLHLVEQQQEEGPDEDRSASLAQAAHACVEWLNGSPMALRSLDRTVAYSGALSD